MSEEDFQLLTRALRDRLTSVYSVIRIPYGWREHVANLHEELFNIYPDYKLTTCTESVGRLLYRVDPLPLKVANGTNNRFHTVVHSYEQLSETICMVCGQPGSTAHNAWARTLCEPCNDEHSEYFALRNDLYTRDVPQDEWPEDLQEFFAKIKGDKTALTPAG